MTHSDKSDPFGEGQLLDDVFDVLGNVQRRHLLYFLREHGEASLDELADVVAAWIGAREGDDVVTPTDRDRVYATLYHIHIPKLTEFDLVRVGTGDDEDVVALESLPEGLDRILDEALELESSVSKEAVAAIRDER